jgi:membrane-associated phospholipid phosphatase
MSSIAGARRDASLVEAVRSTTLAPVDRLVLAFLAALAVVTIAVLPDPLRSLDTTIALAVALLGTAVWATRSRVGQVVHAFFPGVAVVASFAVLGPVIEVANPTRWDDTLAHADAVLFPALSAAWHGALGRPAWLTDVASMAYMTFYAIPFTMGVALYRRGDLRAFNRLTFGVAAACLGCYVMYFLVPALGPRVPQAVEVEVLGGGRVSALVRAFIHAAEKNPLDAFPSGHTALPMVELGLVWRSLPRWRVPVATLIGMIVFSTVYLSYHYVIDVVAGAAFAAVMIVVAPRLERVFERLGEGGLPRAELD